MFSPNPKDCPSLVTTTEWCLPPEAGGGGKVRVQAGTTRLFLVVWQGPARKACRAEVSLAPAPSSKAAGVASAQCRHLPCFNTVHCMWGSGAVAGAVAVGSRTLTFDDELAIQPSYPGGYIALLRIAVAQLTLLRLAGASAGRPRAKRQCGVVSPTVLAGPWASPAPSIALNTATPHNSGMLIRLL